MQIVIDLSIRVKDGSHLLLHKNSRVVCLPYLKRLPCCLECTNYSTSDLQLYSKFRRSTAQKSIYGDEAIFQLSFSFSFKQKTKTKVTKNS